MKSRNRLFWILCGLALVFFSCEKEEEQELPAEGPEKVWSVKIEAAKGEEETKALTLSGTGYSISATWTAGDVVRVYKSGEYLGELSAQSSGKKTTLSGTLAGDLSFEDELTLYYSSQSYRDQDGTLEYISEHCDGAQAAVTIIGISDGDVKTTSASFESKQAITRFTFVDQGGNTLTPDLVVIRAHTGIIDYDIDITGKTDESSYNSGSIYVTNSGGLNSLYVAMKEYDIQRTYLFVVYVGDAVYTGQKKAKILEGRYYITNVTVSQYTPEYVDMGLSVKWATCNLGGYYPTASGDYYAWGEITPKTEYSWTNYAWGYWDSSVENYSTLTKYNPTDQLSRLEMEDDAAHQRLGSGWWIPTSSNWEELLNADNCEFKSDYSAGYVKITSKKTGNYIFLPAAGLINDAKLFGYNLNDTRLYNLPDIDIQDNGSNLYGITAYWSSTRSGYGMYNCGMAYEAYGNPVSNFTYAREQRANGMPIRPVYIDPVTSISFDSPSVTLPCLDYTAQLTYTVSPESGSVRTTRWESSNPSVATVDQNGKVTSVSTGTATITVIMDEEVSASCSVTVKSSNETFLRYKRNYRDGSYTNSHDSRRTRYYSSLLAGFSSASVIEMKFKLNGTGYLGSGNMYDDEAYISVTQNSVSCRDDAGNTFSFPISDYGIAATDMMILKYDGVNHTFTINGHVVECSSLTTFSFDYMLVKYYNDTADFGSDDDDECSYVGIPNDSKIYYIKAYNASNKVIRTGKRSTSTVANSANSSTKEYCWVWTNSSGATTNEFASYTGFDSSTYEPFEAQ